MSIIKFPSREEGFTRKYEDEIRGVGTLLFLVSVFLSFTTYSHPIAYYLSVGSAFAVVCGRELLFIKRFTSPLAKAAIFMIPAFVVMLLAFRDSVYDLLQNPLELFAYGILTAFALFIAALALPQLSKE